MSRRKTTKKWIVDHVVVDSYGEMVPLYVDPDDGMFWFEFPEGGTQYAGCDRASMTAGIKQVVADHHTQKWTQHIAVEESAPWDRAGRVPPRVGFDSLFRFERSIVELRVPRLHGRNKAHEVQTFRRITSTPKPERKDWDWKIVRSTTLRLFPGDTAPLWAGDNHRGSLYINRNTLVFDYDEELWVRLVAIHEACVAMHEQLRDLLAGKPEEASNRILALGTQSLLEARSPDST